LCNLPESVDVTPAEADTRITLPAIEIRSTGDGTTALLSGHWTLRGLSGSLERVQSALQRLAHEPALHWDLREMAALDTTGALILWRAWDRALPQASDIPERHRRLFDYWVQQDEAGAQAMPRRPSLRGRAIAGLAVPARAATGHTLHWLRVLGQLAIDTAGIVRRPADAPWRELSVTIYLAGLRALPITGLVGVLIGVVVAYLTALQLRDFGADQFIVDMIGFAIIRELGPILAAIIVAGRSGSAMTAQIGVMRLTQELDAMAALGMSISRRLIWPKVVGLIIVMPLVALWTILAALAGGIAATQVTLQLGVDYFVATMPDRVPVANLWIGLSKAVTFGAVVGLTSAHFGLRIQPNTRDLGAQTTRAVVASITLVIVINAVFAVALQDIGFR
jgi:phospholipid/cholesterol/gamma-HCH transport system permease protein